MRKIFVDTGAFIAKELAADQHHQQAATAWAELIKGGIQIFSTEHILDESATLLARRTTYAWASSWGIDALDSGIVWLRSGVKDLNAAFQLMRKYADQGVSFTDAMSFAIMHREGIKQVFGFDRHFEAAGFRLWSSRRP